MTQIPLTGQMLIGSQAVLGTSGVLRAVNPATNCEIAEPAFGLGGAQEVDRAAKLAAAALDPYRSLPLPVRAQFLDRIAENIVALGDTLIERAHAETGLPVARLQGERGRTVQQLKLFSQVVRDGRFLSASIDPAQPERQPVPRADLRLIKIPLGPVAVFGASNFPLAFSVAGGDTASALAAGAPVIVKAHSAHLGTSELVGRAIQKAVHDLGLPEGVFSLLIGRGRDVGEKLVAHPLIKAVGFTGSRQGGLALTAIANRREEPIPVYAEMSSINPVYLLPAALQARGEHIAQGFIDSLVMGAGQFCTNPGLVLAMDGPGLDSFLQAASTAIAGKTAQTMLTSGIHQAYEQGTSRVRSMEGVQAHGTGLEAGNTPNCARATLFVTTAEQFLNNPALHSEMFGPASVIVKVRDEAQLLAITETLEGQLTATLQMDAADHELASRLLPILERRAGRILANGFPTGVEVCHAKVHAGPFPSSSNSMFTSVGATAIDRFLRPVCYQDIPHTLLPEAVKDGNPLQIVRLVNGQLESAGLSQT